MGQHRKITLTATEHSETAAAAQNEALQLCRLVSLGRLTPRQALDLIEIGEHDHLVLSRFFGDNRAAQTILRNAVRFRRLVRQEFFKLAKTLAKNGESNGHGHGGPAEEFPAGA